MYFNLLLVLFSICMPVMGFNIIDTLSESKIVGGVSTSIENAPYMAFFMPNDINSCDGSIVNKNQVLTAAHCVKEVSVINPKIKVGSTLRDSFPQTFDVVKVVPHPKYTNEYDYDAAVLTINGTFEFNESVAPIALADKDFNLPEGALVKISGWGSTKKTIRPNKLQEVTVPIVAQKTCIEAYDNVTTITDNMVCAGLPEKDSCQGDSGGPMTYKGKLAGIVSFGKDCGHPEFPGVYTRVSAMRPWLDTVLNFE